MRASLSLQVLCLSIFCNVLWSATEYSVFPRQLVFGQHFPCWSSLIIRLHKQFSSWVHSLFIILRTCVDTGYVWSDCTGKDSFDIASHGSNFCQCPTNMRWNFEADAMVGGGVAGYNRGFVRNMVYPEAGGITEALRETKLYILSLSGEEIATPSITSLLLLYPSLQNPLYVNLHDL